jgi:hypothetical protein
VESNRPENVPAAAPASGVGLLERLIALAEAQIAASLARAANLDAQALGLIGLNAVFAAAALAAQQQLGDLWWIPMPGLALSIGAGAWVIAVTRFDLGPSPGDFYTRTADEPPDAALLGLLADLLTSQERNADSLRLKSGRLLAGLIVLILTAIYAVPVLALA